MSLAGGHGLPALPAWQSDDNASLAEPPPAITHVIFKIASRCNLDCSYCYVYNKADTTWAGRPALMSDEIFELALQRVRRHCELSRQTSLLIAFHGGEPCLIGPERFDSWCRSIRSALASLPDLELAIQTNGTLIDDEWLDVFQRHSVAVGLSLDGPKDVHDAVRYDHKGGGSYEDVARGLQLLHDRQIRCGVLCVIPLGVDDPVRVHRHFRSLGCGNITYLMPHYTHDTIGPIRKRYGPTPCADFLMPVFDEWWDNDTTDICIGDLRNIARILLGGDSKIETYGNIAPAYAFIETDGEIEGLDSLRVCRNGISKIDLNVRDAELRDILTADSMHSRAMFDGMPLPSACHGCQEADTCAGGYLPHRFSAARGFDNPSVWCADILRLFAHMRIRLGITAQDTEARRRALLTNTRCTDEHAA